MVRDRKIETKYGPLTSVKDKKVDWIAVKELLQKKDLVVRSGDEFVISINDGGKFS